MYVNLRFWLKWFSRLDVQNNFCVLQLLYIISYCYGYHNQTSFIHIFQMKHFSAVKFAMGYEKNMSFLVIPKFPKVWKAVEKNQTGLL